MDYGGVDRRKTKKDLKWKRRARGYKRGGQFRTAEVTVSNEEVSSSGKQGSKKRKRRY